MQLGSLHLLSQLLLSPPPIPLSPSSSRDRPTFMIPTLSPTIAMMSLVPPELYYSIFAFLPTQTLLTLACTSRTTQHPAESLLYRSVSLSGKAQITEFCELVIRCRGGRLGPLIRQLTLGGQSLSKGKEDEYEDWERFWAGVREALSTMRILEKLAIDVGRDEMLGWVLRDTGIGLRILKCGFALDAEFTQFLATQDGLEDLSWTGNPYYICYDDSVDDTCNTEATHDPSDKTDTSLNTSPHPSRTTSFLLSHLLPGSLPNLRTLHTESLPLARALVPGRPVRHLWVPGAHFASAERTRMEVAYVYGHVSVSAQEVPEGREEDLEGQKDVRRRRRYPWLPRSLADSEGAPSTDTQIASLLCATIRDFGRGTGPMLSLRLCLGLVSSVALCDVFSCIAKELPELRTLGFVPGFGGETEPPFFAPLSTLSSLRTLVLWSVISPHALRALEKACPALRTIACLHFSPSCEYLCLPVNVDSGLGKSMGNVEGEVGDEDERERARQKREGRPYALHDPENRLWRDV